MWGWGGWDGGVHGRGLAAVGPGGGGAGWFGRLPPHCGTASPFLRSFLLFSAPPPNLPRHVLCLCGVSGRGPRRGGGEGGCSGRPPPCLGPLLFPRPVPLFWDRHFLCLIRAWGDAIIFGGLTFFVSSLSRRDTFRVFTVSGARGCPAAQNLTRSPRSSTRRRMSSRSSGLRRAGSRRLTATDWLSEPFSAGRSILARESFSEAFLTP